ncbi:MAG: hypothetical protein OXF19_07630, partial [Hyphomicrobiales bacterium]|nr:hypothetical protein [Hyphomicrobiales bacterium]
GCFRAVLRCRQKKTKQRKWTAFVTLDREITREDIIRGYDASVKNIETETKKNSERTYGGAVRSFNW